MVRVPVFNTNSILSVKYLVIKQILKHLGLMARRIVSVAVILFVLLYIGAKDVCIFAQTAEKEPGRVHDEKDDHSQTKPSGGVPSVEPPAQSEPELIRQTVEPVGESWGSAKGFGEKIDWIHANLYKTVQDQVQKFDYWFKPPAGKEQIVELSRFRVGLFGEGKDKKNNRLNLNPLVDFHADIELPNMKRRLKIIITTLDPTKLPGRKITEQQDTALRALVSLSAVYSYMPLSHYRPCCPDSRW